MNFRRKLFLVVFFVGLVPSLAILVASALLLNSTLNRIGAAGLENSLDSASELVTDTESALGGLLKTILNEGFPSGNEAQIRSWMKKNRLDLAYELKEGKISRLYTGLMISHPDDVSISNPFKPGLAHVTMDGRFFICYSMGDSLVQYGCGIEMPAGYEQAGRELAEARSVSASLGFYKSFSLELLAVATAATVAVILLAGFLLSSLVSGHLVWPVKVLAEGARKFGSGDLDFRVKLSGKDEFSRLGDSFNRMAGEIKENQRKILEAERLAAWREVARRIAHEIRNPLTPITIELYRLRQQFSEKRVSESQDTVKCIEAIETQIRALQDLSSQFSLFAKEPEIKPERCRIAEIVDGVVALYRNLENLNISVEIPDDIPELSLDRKMMGRVFGNLLKNSLESSTEGAEIRITASKGDGTVKIVIRDNGPGFPPEKLDRIEQPYITSKASGTGLGMAISKKIVEEHGGTIVFHNDNGAVVEIILPAGNR